MSGLSLRIYELPEFFFGYQEDPRIGCEYEYVLLNFQEMLLPYCLQPNNQAVRRQNGNARQAHGNRYHYSFLIQPP